MSLVGRGCGGETNRSIDAAFEDLDNLGRCIHRIHRFSPGVKGHAFLHDGDRCASLGHWSLIASGRVERSSITPSSLCAACRDGRLNAIEALVSDYGLDINYRDTDGWTALHTAMLHGSAAACGQLFALGAEDVATNDGLHASSLWRGGVSGRDEAVHSSFLSRLWSLVVGRTAESAENAVNQLVMMMGEGTVSTDALCRRICFALEQLGDAVLQTFCTDRCLLEGRLARWTLLTASVWTGRHSLCRVCVELGADVNKADGDDATPLFVASWKGRMDCARLLLDRGANADMESLQGWTPLYIACQNGNLGCARLLVNRGADVDKETINGWTPLRVACEKGHVECARFLLDRGADLATEDDDGAAPLYIACASGQLDCARLLVDRGAEVDSVIEAGATPLHGSCFGGHRDAALFLLEQGADPTKKDIDEQIPADYACADVAGSAPDPELANVMELAARDRAAAMQQLQQMTSASSDQEQFVVS